MAISSRASRGSPLVTSGPGQPDPEDLDVAAAAQLQPHDELQWGERRNLALEVPHCDGDQLSRDGPSQILFRSRSFFPITIRWISEVPSPITRSGASRYSRSISYSFE